MIVGRARLRRGQCPSIGCDRPPNVRVVIEWPDGRQRIVRACKACIWTHVGRKLSGLMTAAERADL